ncbi:hypothetical protein ACLOJK_000973 [Asimina triloba]
MIGHRLVSNFSVLAEIRCRSNFSIISVETKCRPNINVMQSHAKPRIQKKSLSVQFPEPGCKRVLEPVLWQVILPPDVFDWWSRALCESLIPESMKFYCPFEDCLGLLVDERGEDGVLILESECPHCRSLFCANCKAPWHSEISCDDYQKMLQGMNTEDKKRANLEKKKKRQSGRKQVHRATLVERKWMGTFFFCENEKDTPISAN